MKLLCVPTPKVDENIFSYVNRLSQANKYETNSWILNMTNIKHYHGPRNLLPINFNFDSFKSLTKLPLEELMKFTFWKEYNFPEEKYDHLNYLLFNNSLMGQNSKVCPICLEEFKQNNKLWDIRFLLACPIHRCFLVCKCSHCNKIISQYRKSFFHCTCGSDLRNEKIKACRVESIILPQIIYYSFYGDDKFETFNNNILNKLDLKYIILIFIFFIKLTLRDETRLGSSAIPFDPGDSEFSLLIEKISLIFKDWPYNFHSYLQDYETALKSKPKYDRGSLINTFGYFYIDLYEKFNHPALNFLREEFERYLVINWDRTQLSHSKYIKFDKNSISYISTTEAGKILGVHHSQVRKLVSYGYLQAKMTTDRNPYLLISRESIEKYIENKSNYINRKETSGLLNIDYQTVIELEKDNILKLKRGPQIDESLEYLYDIQKVHQILNIIEKRCQRSSRMFFNFETKNTIDIISSTKFVIGTKLSDILILIITGELTPIGKNTKEKGLKQYRLSTEQVKEKVYKYKIKKQNGVFSIPELSRFLSIGRNLLYRIIQSGFLRTSEEMDKPFILVEDAIYFKQNYITLGQLSDVYSTDYENVLQLLNRFEVVPVLDSFYKKNKIYEFSDITCLQLMK
ncbi:TniQ family protein [Ferdinandcohnia sp. SAFN-114]|uniref:TniQ family protein n=1 Tax=Ferdinandcohnia sp. SAFN-114 TaxID=3387275 RepID=UPI003F7FEC12